jgi:hypothetical protein
MGWSEHSMRGYHLRLFGAPRITVYGICHFIAPDYTDQSLNSLSASTEVIVQYHQIRNRSSKQSLKLICRGKSVNSTCFRIALCVTHLLHICKTVCSTMLIRRPVSTCDFQSWSKHVVQHPAKGWKMRWRWVRVRRNRNKRFSGCIPLL